MKLVQSAPNFSEGRRLEVVEMLANAIRRTRGTLLADHSADPDHNRCVITLIGTPEATRRAILAAARAAVKSIDVSKHRGEHPRVGAVDVVPVVPLLDCTMDECVELSRLIARDFSEILEIPVYLYACSADNSDREHLPMVRRGGLESLRKTGLVGERRPDFGPCQLHPTAGAAIVGARAPLIAFNVNLDTPDITSARTIAAKIRKERSHDHRLSGVRAIGVDLASRGITQVSTNITKPCPSSLTDVYSYVANAAGDLGVAVKGAELIGCIRAEHLDKRVFDVIPNLALSESQILDRWVERYLAAT